jgi:hypothetical protein
MLTVVIVVDLNEHASCIRFERPVVDAWWAANISVGCEGFPAVAAGIISHN